MRAKGESEVELRFPLKALFFHPIAVYSAIRTVKLIASLPQEDAAFEMKKIITREANAGNLIRAEIQENGETRAY